MRGRFDVDMRDRYLAEVAYCIDNAMYNRYGERCTGE